MTFPTIEAEVALQEFDQLMHDCIIPSAASRFDTRGNKIIPMGTKRAAALLGVAESTIRKKASQECDNSNFTRRDLVILLAGGMSPAPLDPLERLAGRVACEVVEHEGVADLYRALLNITAQDGLLCQAFSEAIDPASPGGRGITPQERADIVREIRRLRSLAAALEEALR